MYVLNFYSPVFADQLRHGRKSATIRLGDKSHKYKRGEVVIVTVGFQHSPREKIFEAVIDTVEVKQVRDLSPRDIEHDNPEFRRIEETQHFLEQIYGRPVAVEDEVTVVRFSAISERPSEIAERLRPGGLDAELNALGTGADVSVRTLRFAAGRERKTTAMSEAHSYLEADVNHLVRVLAKPRGVLTRDQLADEAGADHWADGRFDAALREGTERGRIRDMGEGFYELSEQERSQLP